MTEGALNSIISSVGEVLTGMIGWMGQVLAEVTTEPALFLLVIGIPVAFVGINGLRRLISL